MKRIWQDTRGSGNPLLLLGIVAAAIIAAQNHDQIGGFGKPRVTSLAASGCGGSAMRAVTCGAKTRRASSIVFLSAN